MYIDLNISSTLHRVHWYWSNMIEDNMKGQRRAAYFLHPQYQSPDSRKQLEDVQNIHVTPWHQKHFLLDKLLKNPLSVKDIFTYQNPSETAKHDGPPDEPRRQFRPVERAAGRWPGRIARSHSLPPGREAFWATRMVDQRKPKEGSSDYGEPRIPQKHCFNIIKLCVLYGNNMEQLTSFPIGIWTAKVGKILLQYVSIVLEAQAKVVAC